MSNTSALNHTAVSVWNCLFGDDRLLFEPQSTMATTQSDSWGNQSKSGDTALHHRQHNAQPIKSSHVIWIMNQIRVALNERTLSNQRCWMTSTSSQSDKGNPRKVTQNSHSLLLTCADKLLLKKPWSPSENWHEKRSENCPLLAQCNLTSAELMLASTF